MFSKYLEIAVNIVTCCCRLLYFEKWSWDLWRFVYWINWLDEPWGRSGNIVPGVSPHALVPLVVWRIAREPAEASAPERHTCSATWPLPTGMLRWWSSHCSACAGPYFPQSISPPWRCSTTSSVSRGAARCPSGKSMRLTAVKCLCVLLVATSSRFNRCHCVTRLALPLQANGEGLITAALTARGRSRG